jgi:hypothetical protein
MQFRSFTLGGVMIYDVRDAPLADGTRCKVIQLIALSLPLLSSAPVRPAFAAAGASFRVCVLLPPALYNSAYPCTFDDSGCIYGGTSPRRAPSCLVGLLFEAATGNRELLKPSCILLAIVI